MTPARGLRPLLEGNLAMVRVSICALCMVTVVGALAPTASGAEPSKTFALVKGKVIKVGQIVRSFNEVYEAAATVKIIHVYRGNPKLVGRTFVDIPKRADFGGFSDGGAAREPFDVDEVAIWGVYEPEEGSLQPGLDETVPLWFRNRDKEANGTFRTAVALCEEIEKYDQLKPADQLAAAEKLAYSKEPRVGYWAAGVVARADGKAEAGAVERLTTDAKLPVYAQVALDKELCDKKGSNWRTSKGQLEMYERWVSGPTDELTANAVLMQLQLGRHFKYLPPEKGVELMIAAADNPKWRTEDRIRAIDWVMRHGEGMDDQGKPFRWLIDQAYSHKDADFRRAAAANATGLRNAPDHAVTLAKLRDETKDEPVAKVIRDYFERVSKEEEERRKR